MPGNVAPSAECFLRPAVWVGCGDERRLASSEFGPAESSEDLDPQILAIALYASSTIEHRATSAQAVVGIFPVAGTDPCHRSRIRTPADRGHRRAGARRLDHAAFWRIRRRR